MGSGPGLWGWQCHGQRDVEEGMVPPWAGGARGSVAGAWGDGVGHGRQGPGSALGGRRARTPAQGQALGDSTPPDPTAATVSGTEASEGEPGPGPAALGAAQPLPSQHPQALGVCLQCRPEPPQSVALGPGHGEQGLGRRPLGEGRHGRGVQAGQGQQAEPLEQAGEQQEQRGPGQALARAHAAACHGNPGWGGAGLAREWGGAGVGRGRLWRGPREPGLELLAPGTQL